MTLGATAYCRLLVHMEGHDERATVLSALLFRHASMVFVTLTYRHISALCLSTSKNTVMRSMGALIESGLVEQEDALAATARRYRVDMDRLRKLLLAPLPDVRLLPGITPISALDELADECLDDTRKDAVSARMYCLLLAQLQGRSSEANVLAVLLACEAHQGFVTLTYRGISALCLATRTTAVMRSIGVLIEMGLVEQEGTATTARRYRVDMEHLRELLLKPLPDVPLLPGITPIPALDELAERLQTRVSQEETS